MADNLTETGLRIPEDQDWPVLGRDRDSGALMIRAGFIEAVEEANGLEVGTLTEDDIRRVLVIWYIDRLDRGAPRDAVMDQLVKEELGGLPDEDEYGDEDEDDGEADAER